MKKVVSLFLMLFIAAAATNAQWKKTSFPTPEVLTLFSTDEGNLLLSEYSSSMEYAGVYISKDEGVSFTKTSLPDFKFTSFCTAGDYVFAGGDEGRIGRSSDGGETWTVFRCDDLFDRKISESGDMIYFNDRVYFGIIGAGVVYSDDFGENWHLTDTLSMVMDYDVTLDGRNVMRLEAYDGKLYALASHGFFAYDEEADYWYLVKDDTYFAISSEIHKGKLYVGYSSSRLPFVDCYDGVSGVWKSLDCPEQAGDNNAWALLEDPKTGILYCATTQGGVIYTEDEGATWKSFSDGLPFMWEDNFDIYLNLPRGFAILNDKIFVTVFNPASPEKAGVYVRELADITSIDENVEGNPLVRIVDSTICVEGEFDILNLYDITGKRIYSGADKRVDIASAGDGIYIYQLFAGDEIFCGKISL